VTAPANRPSFEGVIGDMLRRLKILEAQPFNRKSGWTAVFGDFAEPVVVGDDQAVWQVPYGIIGNSATNWFVCNLEAGVFTPSSSGDIEIWLYRRRTDDSGTVISTASLLDDPIVIEEGEHSSRSAGVQPAPSQGGTLLDWAGGPSFDFISIQVASAGVGAAGLSVNVGIGPETSNGFA